MKYDHTWEAVIRPGAATRFFRFEGGGMPKRPRFRTRILGYSPVNAWWLSELSRLIYVREADENGGRDTGRSRNDILSTVNLRELCFINKNGIQCALVTSCDNIDFPFAVLVFRGTNALKTWLSNLNTLQTVWDTGGLVHAGFKYEFCKIRDEMNECLLEVPSHFPIFYTGHSLGGALAVLAASIYPPAAVYTFGQPKVGDAAFAHSLRAVPIFRVVNERDLVPLLPPSRIPFDFCHVGELCGFPPAAGRNIVFTSAYRRSRPIEPMTGPFAELRVAKLAYLKQRLTRPPEFLSDHAPVNYSLRLQREIFLT